MSINDIVPNPPTIYIYPAKSESGTDSYISFAIF